MKWPIVFERDTSPRYTPVRQASTDSNSLLQAMAAHSASQAPRSDKYASAARYASASSDDESSGGSGSDMDLEAGRPLFKHIGSPAGRRVRPFLGMRTTRTVALCIACLVSILVTYHLILPTDLATRIIRPVEPPEEDTTPKWSYGDDSDSPSYYGNTTGPESEGYAIASDQTHLLVPVRRLTTPPPRLLLPMDSRPRLDLLSHFYVTGQLPVGGRSHTQAPIDLVYMYVNATSPYFGPAKDSKVNEENILSLKGKFRHWRDNGELRGAMRSGAMSLGKYVGAVHLVSAAYDLPEGAEVPPEAEALVTNGTVASGTRWRMGQIPEWLNTEDKGNLRNHFHPDLFRLPRDNDGKTPPSVSKLNEEDWQRKALPTFNSFSIENRVGMIPDLADTFIMSNDDMFSLQIMAPTDFHHPLLGPVHRLDPGMTVEPKLTPTLLSSSGEWGGLQHAAYLISQRFTTRQRMYEHHMPKAMSRSLTHEASIMFAEPLAVATTRTFRESKRGVGDIEMSWLVTQLQIERWREALLWSFIVARVGGPDGKWGEGARDEMRSVLGLDKGDEGDVVVVKSGRRETIVDVPYLDRHGGWEDPKNSFYRWCKYRHMVLTRPVHSHEQLRLTATCPPTPKWRRSVPATFPSCSACHAISSTTRPSLRRMKSSHHWRLRRQDVAIASSARSSRPLAYVACLRSFPPRTPSSIPPRSRPRECGSAPSRSFPSRRVGATPTSRWLRMCAADRTCGRARRHVPMAVSTCATGLSSYSRATPTCMVSTAPWSDKFAHSHCRHVTRQVCHGAHCAALAQGVEGD